MVNWIRTMYPWRLNKGFGLKFYVDSKFDMKHLKKAEGHIGQNVVNITMKIKTIVFLLNVFKNVALTPSKKI